METISYRISYLKRNSWVDYLNENGFVVISDFFKDFDSKHYHRELINVMHKLSGGKLSPFIDQSWEKCVNWPPSTEGGTINYVGHTNIQWELREQIAPLFANLYQCQESQLASSYEGFCFMYGKKNHKLKRNDHNQFLSVDQAHVLTAFQSVQSYINIYDNNENDGGYVVVPKSHKYFEEFFKQKKLPENEHLFKYSFTDVDKLEDIFSTSIKLCCKAGDVILWDSRIFHGNILPKTNTNFFAGIHICMIPKWNPVSEEGTELLKKVLMLRRRALFENRTITHHPINSRMNPSVPSFVKLIKNRSQLIEMNRELSIEKLNEYQTSLAWIDSQLFTIDDYILTSENPSDSEED